MAEPAHALRSRKDIEGLRGDNEHLALDCVETLAGALGKALGQGLRPAESRQSGKK